MNGRVVVAQVKSSYGSVVGWMLLACPLFGVAVALDAGQAGWVSVNPAFLALLFGVPAALTWLTAALAGLTLKTTIALTTSAVAMAGAWLVIVLMLSGALS
jgi:hypothetical protein